MVREKLRPREAGNEDTAEGKRLMLHNDEVNTFEFVIECLIDVCHHEPEQAEQCALIAHFKGKCPVKSGDPPTLKPYYKEMTSRGLTVTID
jgi:ATP-dependent Clp protease adaptor protein ClpS